MLITAVSQKIPYCYAEVPLPLLTCFEAWACWQFSSVFIFSYLILSYYMEDFSPPEELPFQLVAETLMGTIF